MLWVFLVALLSPIFASSSPAAEFIVDIRDCGARPGGKTMCTEAIQKAVDRCAAKGGGTVRLPAGTWLSGTVYLKSRVTLLLEEGCTLLGSRDIKHYGGPPATAGKESAQSDFRYPALIAGSKLEDVAIRGKGTLDGQGDAYRYKHGKRPKNVYLVDCRNVLIENVKMRNAGCWMQHYRFCDGLTIRGINVFNHVTYNNDGLNVDSCSNVRIADCRVDSDDDGIVLKSLSTRPCENVAITNCTISSHCNAIKMGTESGGGFQKITVDNCTVFSPRHSKKIYGRQRGLAGVALEIVDGGRLEDVEVTDVTIDGVSVPIFMRLGNRARRYSKDKSKPGVGTFRNVRIENITATNTSEIGCSITGLPGHRIENVSLSNIKLGFDGGGVRETASKKIAEKPENYPESTMFGVLPAYGFFCRHAKGLKFHNIKLETAKPDLRHAMVFDDVEQMEIDSLDAACVEGAAATIRLNQVRQVLIRGCKPPKTANPFLKLEGDATRQVVLKENDFARAAKIVELGPDVPKDAFRQDANQRP